MILDSDSRNHSRKPRHAEVLSGAAFPMGLILVVVLGAELFYRQQRHALMPLMAREALLGVGHSCKLDTRLSRQLYRRSPFRVYARIPYRTAKPRRPTIHP